MEEKRKLRHDITLDDYYKYYRENYSVNNKGQEQLNMMIIFLKAKFILLLAIRKCLRL